MAKNFFLTATGLVLLICFAGSAWARAPGRNANALLEASAKTLEDQLSCVRPPQPGLILRGMIAKGILRRTKYAVDGSPVFAPKHDLFVFGKRVKFITGWEEGAKPFWRGPGTSPPLFLKVILDAQPQEVPYAVHQPKGTDGRIVDSPFSTIEVSSEFYDKIDAEIVCYGD